MAERTQIPGAPIPNSAACGQWETLLADALDGLLAAQDEPTFAAHKAACPACATLYEEARQGREWLEFLAPEPEVPAGLVDRILAQTGPGHKTAHPVLAGAAAVALPAGMPAWQRPGFMGFVRRWAEPRLMMTVAMAFFSIALTLNLTGVRLSQMRMADLRPTAVRSFMERRLTMASVPIIRYYDHLWLVYELQSRMRELRGGNDEVPQGNQPGQAQPDQAQPAGRGESQKKDGGSHMETPEHSGVPAQANAVYFGDYVETCLQTGNRGMNKGANGPGHERTWEQGHEQITLKIRAFRRLQNPAGRRASERSRVWTA